MKHNMTEEKQLHPHVASHHLHMGKSRCSWNKMETLQGNNLALQSCYCHTETLPELSHQGD